ncbi:MAG: hypothetical protein QN174_07815 [Armatimonadota bacterium]|nr:hypothetical protein [Armatimonadota bacterium]
MPTVADLLVKIGADVDQLLGALKQADVSLQSFEARIAQAEAITTKLSLGAAAAGAGILAFLGLSIRNAAAAQEEFRRLEAAIQASGKAIDAKGIAALATELQRLAGINDEVSISAAKVLIQFGATEHQVKRLLPIMAALARSQGVDMESSARLFGRALTGMDMGLSRMLGKLGEGVSLAGDFDAAATVLERRLAGQLGVGTLTEALGRLRGAVADVTELLGGPLLQPLIAVITLMARAAEAVRDFAAAHPAAAQAVAVFLGVMGLLLVSVGAYTVAMRTVIPMLFTWAGQMAVVGTTSAEAAVKIGLTTSAVRALGLALRANIIGLAITAAVLLVTHWRQAASILRGVFTFLAGLFVELGEGMAKVIAGILTFDPRRIVEGVDQLRGAFKRAKDAGVEEFRRSMDELTPAQEKAARVAEDAAKSAEELARAYEEAAAAAKLFATEQAAAATRSARLRMEQAGLTEADIKAIEARRQRELSEGAQQELRIRIAAKRKEIEGLMAAEDLNKVRIAKARQELADLTAELEAKRFEDARAVANAIVEAEKAAAEQRIRTEEAVRQAQLDTMRATVDATRTVAEARARAEEDARQRDLSLLRLQEEIRLGMLRRLAETEQQLGADILNARTSLLRAQEAREEIAARQAALRRAQLVEQGFLTEEQAREQAAQEAIARERRRLQAQQDLEERRLAQIQRNLAIERAIADQEAASRLQLFQAEVDARRQALAQQQALEETNLRASIEIARAETQAKIAELQARLSAVKATTAAELAAREAAGQITPAERQARQQALASIDQEFLTSAQALVDALAVRQDAVAEQIRISRARLNADLKALDRETALRQAQIVQELAATKTRLERAAVQDRAAALERLADLEVRAAKAALDEEERLRVQVRAGEITQAEMDRRLGPIKAVQDQISRLVQAQKTGTEAQLKDLEASYTSFAQRVGDALKPLKELLDTIANPGKITAGIGAAVRFAGAIPATAGVSITQNVTNTFAFNGNTFTLTADESAILGRLVSFLLGPEGNELVNRYFKRTPGPRR